MSKQIKYGSKLQNIHDKYHRLHEATQAKFIAEDAAAVAKLSTYEDLPQPSSSVCIDVTNGDVKLCITQGHYFSYFNMESALCLRDYINKYLPVDQESEASDD